MAKKTRLQERVKDPVRTLPAAQGITILDVTTECEPTEHYLHDDFTTTVPSVLSVIEVEEVKGGRKIKVQKARPDMSGSIPGLEGLEAKYGKGGFRRRSMFVSQVLDEVNGFMPGDEFKDVVLKPEPIPDGEESVLGLPMSVIREMMAAVMKAVNSEGDKRCYEFRVPYEDMKLFDNFEFMGYPVVRGCNGEIQFRHRRTGRNSIRPLL